MSHQVREGKTPEGNILELGSRMILRSGTVKLEFASGVRSIIRGPADLTLQREDLLELQSGTAWFHVPKKAVGFKVSTPDLVLTDLGTEFGLLADPGALDEVHVFTGKVVLTDQSGKLASGIEAIRFTASHVATSVGNAFAWREIDVFGEAAK